VFFDPEMTSRASERLRLETELRRALAEEQFVVHYQPQVNLQSGETEGFEALARWRHPERGLVSPSEFIPLAEETGLIVDLDRLVLRNACREMSGLSQRLRRSMRLAVNISAVHLGLPDLSKTVSEIASDEGFELGKLEVEVTETAILRDPAAAERVLHELCECGITAALDDFGTGYSSLSHLQRLPIQRLKIDRSFVMALPEDQGACSIVASVVDLAHNLGCDVIAEGVETPAQLRFLQKEGCDAGQGYYFGRPSLISDWVSQGMSCSGQ
jgi:EAL domain-containing protein (putative c-di-GMP-specific phosphodiesterase class I)